MKQIQELALRNENGKVKKEVYQSALAKLKMKDIDRKILPSLFYKEITKNDSQLANISIQEVLAFDDEDIRRVFGKASKPILKSFDALQQQVEEMQDEFYQCFISSQQIYIDLEINADDTIVNIIDKLFLFCTQLFENNLIENYNNKELEKHERLSLYLQGLDTEEISKKYNESSENSRRIIKNESLFSKILKDEVNFKIDESTLSAINTFKQCYLYNSKFFEELKSEITNDQKQEILRKLEFLNIYGFDFETDRIRTYLSETEVLKFRGYLNDFNQFIKKTEEYYTLSELHIAFDKYYAKEEERKLENTLDFFAKIVDQFTELDKKWDDNIQQYLYYTQWGYLANMSLKVTRILLDQEVIMSTSEIFEAFNKRSAACGQEVLQDNSDLSIKSSTTVHSTQHGFWVYSKEKISKKDVREVINEFIISKNGVVHFEEVEAYVKSLNYKYPNSSIRAYIQIYARKSVENSELFVHEDYIESSGIAVHNRRNNLIGKELIPIFQEVLQSQKQDISKKQLQRLVNEKCKEQGIILSGPNTIYNYIDRFKNAGIYVFENGKIIADSINKQKLLEVEYRPEPNYRKHIRNEAISILKETESNQLRIKDIYSQLFHLMPANVSNTNFYRIFSESELFSTHEIDGKLYYQLEVSLLPEAKPFTEEVFEPEEILITADAKVEKQIEEAIVSEVNEEAVISQNQSNYNFGFQLNNDQIFDFIYTELGRKYKNAAWFNEGFNEFKSILGNQSNVDQHWGNKILKSLGRVLVNISDFYDRDSCLQRLSLSFETYLKQFEETFKPSQSNLGLIITNTSKLKVLLDYFKNNEYKYGDIIYEFSKSLSKIWTYRNTYAHDQDSDKLEITITDHIKYIMDFIGLYIFIPYYFKNA